MTDFAALLRALIEGRVAFILIGGVAATVHGSARLTRDVDVIYDRSPHNIDALARAVTPLHPYLRGAPPGLPFTFDVATVTAGLNFTLKTDLGDIDLLGEVLGVGGYADAVQASTGMAVHGLEVRVLDLDGLARAKRAAGRVKDLLDLAEIAELKKR